MNPISPELFLEHENLFLSVYVDLNDGKGLRHLPPDQPIYSVPHALSADLAERAKVAEEANVAKSLLEGSVTASMLSSALRDKIEDNQSIPNRSITESMLSDSVKQGIAAPISASRLDPSFKAYLSPLLEPKATGAVTDRDRLEGKNVTLSAPSASGYNLSYQWKKNGNPIPGATSKDLIITDLNATIHSGNYQVVVSNDFGSFSQSLALNVFGATAVQMVGGDHHALYLDAMGFPYGVGLALGSGEFICNRRNCQKPSQDNRWTGQGFCCRCGYGLCGTPRWVPLVWRVKFKWSTWGWNNAESFLLGQGDRFGSEEGF
jgi:hypothetical protein